MSKPPRCDLLPMRACANEDCAKEFRPRRGWQTFCSEACRNAHHHGSKIGWQVKVACVGCSTEFVKPRPWSRFCSDVCRQTYNDQQKASRRKAAKSEDGDTSKSPIAN